MGKRCPICRLRFAQPIQLYMSLPTPAHRSISDSKLAVVDYSAPPSQAVEQRVDALLDLSRELSQQADELARLNQVIERMSLEHSKAAAQALRKHEIGQKQFREEVQRLHLQIDEQRREMETLRTGVALLESQRDALKDQMDETRALRACGEVKEMLRHWSDQQMRDQHPSQEITHALAIKCKLQQREMQEVQSELAKVTLAKQLLERENAKLKHSSNQLVAEPVASAIPMACLQRHFEGSIGIAEVGRRPPPPGDAGHLFRVKEKRPTTTSGHVSDGMGGRAKVIRSGNRVIDLV